MGPVNRLSVFKFIAIIYVVYIYMIRESDETELESEENTNIQIDHSIIHSERYATWIKTHLEPEDVF